jgi:hypothetical protein
MQPDSRFYPEARQPKRFERGLKCKSSFQISFFKPQRHIELFTVFCWPKILRLIFDFFHATPF